MALIRKDKKWSALPGSLLLPMEVIFAVVAHGNHRVPLSANRFYWSQIRPLKKRRELLLKTTEFLQYYSTLSGALQQTCLHACLSRWAVFFLMNPGLQPYLTRPHLKSMGEFFHPSRHTSSLTLQPPLLAWVCAKPRSGQRERLKGQQCSPPTRFLHCTASQIKKSHSSS